eukprot:274019-Prymnesium_polylepis.1
MRECRVHTRHGRCDLCVTLETCSCVLTSLPTGGRTALRGKLTPSLARKILCRLYRLFELRVDLNKTHAPWPCNNAARERRHSEAMDEAIWSFDVRWSRGAGGAQCTAQERPVARDQ